MIRFNYTKVMVILSVLTFSLSVLTSCENEGDFTPHNDLLADSEIRISASVNQLVATRAETGESYNGKTLGLYIRPTSAKSWTHKERTEDGSVANDWYTYPNVKFTKNGSEWSQDTYAQMLWKGANETYEYYAYAPYDASVTYGNIIYYDLIDQDLRELPDLLRATKTGTASSLVNSDGKLDILFEHVFCRVCVNITLADEFYQINPFKSKIESVSISSSRSGGTVDVFTGEFTSNSDEALPLAKKSIDTGISTKDGKWTSHYISYAPGKEKFRVEINTFEEKIDDTTDAPTIASRTFTYTHNEPFDFQSGYSYTINLKMGYDVVQLDEISVSPWKIESEVPGELETE